MFSRRLTLGIAAIIILSLILAACSGGSQAEKVCVVLDTGGENDKSFNEFTLKGARDAAEEEGLEFAHIVSEAATDYEEY
jgi:basic membrane lipoprotein Med (substrate-binding protein (PBP1-ABC) superfamily)